MYVVTDYSDELRLVYNEKPLGVFLKKQVTLYKFEEET